MNIQIPGTAFHIYIPTPRGGDDAGRTEHAPSARYKIITATVAVLFVIISIYITIDSISGAD